MRPGLVIVGALLLVLAVAAIGVVTFAPNGTHEVRNSLAIPVQDLLPNATNFALLTGANASDGTFSISWSSTIPSDVALFQAPGCRSAALACASGPAVQVWTQSHGGNWSVSGSLGFPYLILWNTSSPIAGTWGLTGTETTTTSLTPGVFQTLVIDLAGGALAVVGAVAVFLGLFLRGGAYLGAAPIVSRSAEDVETVARAPGPPKR
ncbi:MAG: hypothetical protein L3K06_04930 [Thermoplasmata archaeon]|nr:hypothetical protein [Thermoplasmata archaeon]MCI4354691.1 hypothetical protein [Thermoplasmata archaeon]